MRWTNKIANTLQWANEISNREQKEAVANQIAKRVKDGDVIGFGSGSTAFLAIQAISKRIKEENLKIMAIPTSYEIKMTCAILGIPTVSLMEMKPDWGFDGADEVDADNNLIKGRGGAMFAEKLVMKSSPENYILVDDSKLVKNLGEKFAVPVEVFPNAIHLVEESLNQLGATEVQIRLAKKKDGAVITEAGNFILDVRFAQIKPGLEKEIKAIPGVIESGLFMGYNVKILKA